MKSRELTNEVISVSDQRDVVISAVERAIRDTWTAATRGGLLGKPSPEKIGAKFDEQFPVILKKTLEADVPAIQKVGWTRDNISAGVDPQTQDLLINPLLLKGLAKWVQWNLNNDVVDIDQILDSMSKPIDEVAEILVHEIVHLEQQARQPGYAPGTDQKDYRSYLAKSMDQFISAITRFASQEDSDIYHASPQEIPAYAHQMVYRLISQALGGKKLADIPQDEIPYAVQELKDALKDIASGMSAKDETLTRYLGFKSGDERRVKVYKRFMKAVYSEVQAYISKMQAQQSGQLSESFDKPYAITKQAKFDRVNYGWTGDDGRKGGVQFRLEDSDMNSWGLIFVVDGTIELSGGGDAQRIFATVIACLKDWLATEGQDAYGLSFAAAHNEPSRIKLYDRFARMMPKFGFRDAHSNFQTHHSKFYEFTRIGMEPPEERVPELIPPEEQIEESHLTEIERVGGQNFPIENVERILQHCEHEDGDSIDGLDLWMGRNGNERYIVLVGPNNKIASFAGFVTINNHRWQVKNAQSYGGFTGRRLIAKIYKELFDGGISILSDFQQSSGAEHIWCSLPSMGLKPLVWDSESEEIYNIEQIGMDKIYSNDPGVMYRYCWILDHYVPKQNLVYEGKMLMPLKGLWYTKRKRFKESASSGATCSGGIAPVMQPLGGMVRRSGSGILAGINTAEEYPNTPSWMQSYKKRSQNRKRSK